MSTVWPHSGGRACRHRAAMASKDPLTKSTASPADPTPSPSPRAPSPPPVNLPCSIVSGQHGGSAGDGVVTVTLSEGVKPGDQLKLTSPTGVKVLLQVPEGAVPEGAVYGGPQGSGCSHQARRNGGEGAGTPSEVYRDGLHIHPSTTEH